MRIDKPPPTTTFRLTYTLVVPEARGRRHTLSLGSLFLVLITPGFLVLHAPQKMFFGIFRPVLGCHLPIFVSSGDTYGLLLLLVRHPRESTAAPPPGCAKPVVLAQEILALQDFPHSLLFLLCPRYTISHLSS